jgi:hydroxyacylglutathione hydrolase
MLNVICFRFQHYNENTYLAIDSTRECVVIDPGCYSEAEKNELLDYIQSKDLKLTAVLNTHCHIDHVFGNAFLMKQFSVPLHLPEGELRFLEAMPQFALRFGFQFEQAPKEYCFLKEGKRIHFGKSSLEIISTPGHSPDSMSFFSSQDNLVFGGDALFRNRIGRVDLPGGNYETLCNSIKTKLFPLGDDVTVFSGHGVSTNMGYEKDTSRFICWMKN